MQKLLFIDDDIDLLKSNEKFFSRSGYHVETACDGASALRVLKRIQPDCIILDVMLPDVAGFDLIRKIHAICTAPVIFLSGKTDENARITGLTVGGNDYVIKPYSLRELEARIQVQIRNAVDTGGGARLSFPPLSLDVASHKAYYNESQEILLSNREYAMLSLLMTNPGKTITFEEIGQALWGGYTASGRKSIMMLASRLRKKLGDYDGLDCMIETVWTEGYKFVETRRGPDG